MKYLLKLTGMCLAVITGTQICNAGAFDAKSAVFDSGIYQPVQLFNDTTNIYGMRLSLFMTENRTFTAWMPGTSTCPEIFME